MVSVLIVPASEASYFHGMSLIAWGGSIVALAGVTFKERTRGSFDSEDEFLDAVACGSADLNTFENYEEASKFGAGKIESLNEKARRIEEVMERMATVPQKKIPPAESRLESPANQIA